MAPKRTSEAPLERWPVFSTTDRGLKITSLEDGHSAGRVGPVVPLLVTGMVVWALASTVLFGGLLGLAPTPTASMFFGHPVTVGGGVVLVLIAMGLTVHLHARADEQFGQDRVALLFALVTVVGGIAAAGVTLLAWTLTTNPSYSLSLDSLVNSPTIPLEVGAVIAAALTLVAVFAALCLSRAVSHARARQHGIEYLRANGRKVFGTLSAVTFSQAWIFDQPMFTTEVSYESAEGPRTIAARLRTDADRVPLVGTPVLIFTDDRGHSHVELERNSGLLFDPNVSRYEPSEG